MWALFSFYDMELVEDKKEKRINPFHRYKPSEFRRVTDKDGERSHFFGFQSSQKSLFSNLTVVAIACGLLYVKAPRWGFIRAIYNNTALTTAALVFAFLIADKLGPWFLVGVICVLSRFRDAVVSFTRKVKV